MVARWLRPPYDVDGWRIDVANMTGRLGGVDVNHEVALDRATPSPRPAAGRAGCIGRAQPRRPGDLRRRRLARHDGLRRLRLAGVVVAARPGLARAPVRPAGAGAASRGPAVVRGDAGVDRAQRLARVRLVGGTSSAPTTAPGSAPSSGTPEAHRVAVALQFTLPGVPMVFAGDEIGLEGVNGEDARRPMPWHRPEAWDHETLTAYAALAAARRDHVALRRGGLRWAHVGDDTTGVPARAPRGDAPGRRPPGARPAARASDIDVGETVVATADDPLATGVTVYRTGPTDE